MRRLSVTHVVESLDRGGLERVVADLAGAQSNAGHRCGVVCLFRHGTLAAELEAGGVPVSACGKRPGLDLSAIGRLRALLRRDGSEVIHTHNAVAHYYAVAASAGPRRPAIINTRHGMGVQDTRSRREWLFRRTLPFTDRVTTVCETARHHYLAAGFAPARKLVTVPNGIRVAQFIPSNPGARERLRASLGLPAATQLIGSVGRLNWAKAPVTLVRAFAEVHRHRRDTALVLIGDGSLRGEVEACVAASGLNGSVRLLGDRADVPQLLAGLDLFALASVTEGYSVALLEACASALPVVATRAGGNGEIVRAGENGWLTETGDHTALAGAILLALGDSAEAARRGQAGRQWVESNGSVEAMSAAYEALYRGSVTAR